MFHPYRTSLPPPYLPKTPVPVDYGDGPSIAGMRSQLAPAAVALANHAAAFFFSMTEESNRVLFSSMAQAT
jgi:hypothetical protein